MTIGRLKVIGLKQEDRPANPILTDDREYIPINPLLKVLHLKIPPELILPHQLLRQQLIALLEIVGVLEQEPAHKILYLHEGVFYLATLDEVRVQAQVGLCYLLLQ